MNHRSRPWNPRKGDIEDEEDDDDDAAGGGG